MKTLDEEVNLLQANRKIAQEGVKITVSDLAEMTDFVHHRIKRAWEQQVELNTTINKLNEKIEQLEKQLDEENASATRESGRVVLSLFTEQAIEATISLSYMTPDAGWTPVYDLRAEKVGEPVQLTYKASVWQDSGIHWDEVPLTLSTGNPSQGAQAPSLHPWYLHQQMPVQTDVLYECCEAVDAAAPIAAGIMQERSLRKKKAVVSSETLAQHVTTHAQGIHVEFEIDIPYSIPCDRKAHMVMIQTTAVPARYYYVLIPKLEKDAFLQARVEDWQNLNLLPGTTSIYFGGTYVGDGMIKLENLKEGLNISLGREKRIIVERTEDVNNSSKAGLLGGGIQRTLAYTIQIHNTRPDTAQIVVKDQLPVSQNKEITLVELNLANAKHNEKTGELEWERTLATAEKCEIAFSYSIRFPKEMMIDGLD